MDISGAQVAAGRTALAAREGGVALRQSTVDSGELAVSTKMWMRSRPRSRRALGGRC
ncbi:hypothetical protein M8494_08805 [Serratia ureilytica]